ncbi:hypothetical protein V2J09_000494 [Rumex salicifolius]
MANLLYVRAELSADLNKNTEWFAYPGVWTTYILIVFFSWIMVLSLLSCSSGVAWTIVNFGHFLTYKESIIHLITSNPVLGSRTKISMSQRPSNVAERSIFEVLVPSLLDDDEDEAACKGGLLATKTGWFG